MIISSSLARGAWPKGVREEVRVINSWCLADDEPTDFIDYHKPCGIFVTMRTPTPGNHLARSAAGIYNQALYGSPAQRLKIADTGLGVYNYTSQLCQGGI